MKKKRQKIERKLFNIIKSGTGDRYEFSLKELVNTVESLLEQAGEEGRKEGWFDRVRYDGLTHTLSHGLLFTKENEDERNELKRKYLN